MSKFIVWQLKRWLVPILVITGVFALSMVVASLQEPLTYITYSGYPVNNVGSFFLIAISYAAIISVVFPMFVFNYKFGIRRADFYKQLPFEPQNLRRIIFSMGLVLLLIAVSLAYFTGIGIFLIRYFTFNKENLSTVGDTITHLYEFKFEYLGYFYILLMLTTFTTYSVTSLIVYHNIGVFESLIAVVLGQLFIGLFPLTTTMQILQMVERTTGNPQEMIYITFSLVSPIIAGWDLNTLFQNVDGSFARNLYWNVGTYLLFGVGSFIWLFLVKDRSADLENERGRPSIITLVAVHGGFLSLQMFFNYLAYAMLYGALIIYLFTMTAYFFINVLFRHGFKLRMEQFIPMAVVAAISLADIFITSYAYNAM